MPLKVFVSYAREDRQTALQVHERLLKEGSSPWIDCRDILPGQNWQLHIDRASFDANLVVLLLSTKSVTKRGFVQKEANAAIERLKEKLPDDIYVIPILLEPCEVPTHLSTRLQYVDLNDPDAWDRIRAALRRAAEQQSIELESGAVAGAFRVYTETIKERWEGAPGHDVDIDYPRFESSAHRDSARELSSFFAGRAFKTLITERQAPWTQMPDLFVGEFDHGLLNERWERYTIAHATDRLLSLSYYVQWYGAGAAHPNSHFETYNFAVLEKVHHLALSDFLDLTQRASRRLKDVCNRELCKQYWQRYQEMPAKDQVAWFSDGLHRTSWHDQPFTVHADRFTFLFGPYEVSSYGAGDWNVDVSYHEVFDFLKRDPLHTVAFP